MGKSIPEGTLTPYNVGKSLLYMSIFAYLRDLDAVNAYLGRIYLILRLFCVQNLIKREILVSPIQKGEFEALILWKIRVFYRKGYLNGQKTAITGPK